MTKIYNNALLVRGGTILAVALFGSMFLLWQPLGADFWWWMSANVLALILYALIIDRQVWTGALPEIAALRSGALSPLIKTVIGGLLTAVLLYVVFAVGNALVRGLFLWAAGGIESVYAFKENTSLLRITLLMACWIGPGEELIWRAFLQEQYMRRFGPAVGWLLMVAVYGGVHLFSGNIMLAVAAGVCGLFWAGCI